MSFLGVTIDSGALCVLERLLLQGQTQLCFMEGQQTKQPATGRRPRIPRVEDNPRLRHGVRAIERSEIKFLQRRGLLLR